MERRTRTPMQTTQPILRTKRIRARDDRLSARRPRAHLPRARLVLCSEAHRRGQRRDGEVGVEAGAREDGAAASAAGLEVGGGEGLEEVRGWVTRRIIIVRRILRDSEKEDTH